MKHLYLILAAQLAFSSCAGGSNEITLSSPDGEDQATITTDGTTLFYNYIKEGESVVGTSKLGLEVAGAEWQVVPMKRSQIGSVENSWENKMFVKRHIEDVYTSFVAEMKDQNSGMTMQVLFRLYDEGLTYKYVVDTQSDEPTVVAAENTEFNLAPGGKYTVLTHPWGVFYEYDVPASEVKDNNLPIYVKATNGFKIILTEGELYNYPIMRLSSEGDGGLRPSKLNFKTPKDQNVEKPVVISGEFESPWRVILAEKSEVELMGNNDLILNLNAPSKIVDDSWIKPGISLWDWRVRGAKSNITSGFEYGLDTESMVRFIDKCAELGLPYFMVDAGWYGEERNPASDPKTGIAGVDMEAVTKHAREKGVGMWLYVNKIGLQNYDIDETFSLYRDWGVVGIKFGFLSANDQDHINYLQFVLEKCNEYHIMLDGHESVIPTGIERTWPHFFSREFSHSIIDGNIVSPPQDYLVYPFLNNFAGPIDITPGFFDLETLRMPNRKKARTELQSTVVAQVAMCLTYNSQVLVLPDAPEAYERKMDLFNYIKSLPLVYDDTKILAAQIGDIYAVARRNGDNWWIAGTTDEQAREFEVDLSFLESGRSYKIEIFTDGEGTTHLTNKEGYNVEYREVTSKDKLTLHMNPGGGVVVRTL